MCSYLCSPINCYAKCHIKCVYRMKSFYSFSSLDHYVKHYYIKLDIHARIRFKSVYFFNYKESFFKF